MAAKVRSDAKPLEKFFATVMNPNFPSRLAEALANPEGPEAKALMAELGNVVTVTAAKIPFHPMQRATQAATELLAMVRHLGLPSGFVTL